jgi:DNA-binding NarL/FixJ family response regulator
MMIEASAFLSLSRADAPLLVLVVPVALVGRRWGRRPALGAAVVAIALVVARTSMGGQGLGMVGYVSRSTAFLTVAAVAGRRQQSDRMNEHLPPATAFGGPSGERLSPRELEVMSMLASGATNAEIAERLVIAENTVQSHVQHILRKLGVRNRTEAAARYLARNGNGASSRLDVPTRAE